MSPPLERLLAAFGEQPVGKLRDRTEKHRRALRDRLLAPAFALDPRAYLEDQRRVARRGDRFTRARIRVGALLVRRALERGQTGILIEMAAHWTDELAEEYVPVTSDPEYAGQPFDLADEEAVLIRRQQ